MWARYKVRPESELVTQMVEDKSFQNCNWALVYHSSKTIKQMLFIKSRVKLQNKVLNFSLLRLGPGANIINYELFHVKYDAQLSHNKKLRITA
jgi:hypothetical protein